jgi:hypothetical protein
MRRFLLNYLMTVSRMRGRERGSVASMLAVISLCDESRASTPGSVLGLYDLLMSDYHFLSWPFGVLTVL